MQINMPVTNNEIVMKPETILVTRTDLKGVITFANDAFVEISGFSRNELIGANHNIVRHPDMPEVAYVELWSTIQKGNPWHRIVKNRAKNGDFWWIRANVTPIFDGGNIVGYMSVRHPPTRDEVDEAEQIYRAIKSGKSVLHSTGVAAVFKKIKEISQGKKLAFASTVLAAPNIFLMVQSFNTANYSLLSFVASATVFGAVIIAKTSNSTRNAIEDAINELTRLSTNKFGKPLDLRRDDQFGDLFRKIYASSVKLGSDLADSRQMTADSLRVIQGLENVQSSVLITNANLEIIFINQAAKALFSNVENDLRRELPNFRASKLLGSNIDVFHKNPKHQRNVLASITTPHKAVIEIADISMNLIATPIFSKNGDRIGFIAEWQDRTLEINIEREIENLVNSIKVGDLSTRISLDKKEGVMKSLSLNINELTDVIECVFNDINRVIKQMANGDLTDSIQTDYQGVYAESKENINNALVKISELIMQIHDAAAFVNNSSQEMASGNNNLSHRVEQQAANLEETAASMHELSSNVKSNAENTQQATKVVQSATQLAEKGGEVVRSAIAAMQEINESSNKIAEIIGVIDEIAFQTNLLALNASVEAARAGEQGRGFSVVATEVRNLAQRSANAAAQSSDLIQNSVQKVRSGTAFVNETGAALMEIVDSIAKVGDIVGQITASSSEQSAGINQVNQAIAQMDDITQQNAALAEEAAAGSMAMSDQSAKMTKLLDFFNVGKKSGSMRNKTVVSKPTAATASQSKAAVAKLSAPISSTSSLNDDWEEF